MAAGHLAGGHDRADMTQELARYAMLALALATVAGVVFEGLRRRAAGTRLDRQLRDQHFRPAHLNRIRRVAGTTLTAPGQFLMAPDTRLDLPIGIVRIHRGVRREVST
jgi:hypothetical protein